MGTFVGIVGKTEVPKEHLETYVFFRNDIGWFCSEA